MYATQAAFGATNVSILSREHPAIPLPGTSLANDGIGKGECKAANQQAIRRNSRTFSFILFLDGVIAA
jgi:hypothetical protein